MHTTITARHTELTESLRDRAQAVAERLADLSPQALEATVLFDEGPLAHRAEIRLHARGRKLLVGVGEGADHRTALDRAEEKLRPQLLKAGQLRPKPRRTPTRDA